LSYTTRELRDSYGRKVDSFRLIVTNRCNYHCIFCHREGLEDVLPYTSEKLKPGDYGFLAKVARNFGVKYYKLTGGEPLLRDDVHEIVREIKPYAEEVSIVTNGSLLRDKARLLADSGVDRVNISLHSLRDDVYRYITGGVGRVSDILDGLKTSLDYGIRVKLNVLVMRSNVDEVSDIIKLAESYGVDVNIIELIPLGTPPDTYKREHAALDPVLEFLEEIATSKITREFQNRPVYVLPSGIRVEVVAGYGNSLMCSACTRLRLTPEGCIKTCLYVSKPCVDIYEAITSRSEVGVIEGLKRAISLRKPYFKSRLSTYG